MSPFYYIINTLSRCTDIEADLIDFSDTYRPVDNSSLNVYLLVGFIFSYYRRREGAIV